jgi:hypothetical protein
MLLRGRINLLIGARRAIKDRLIKIGKTMSAVEPVILLYSNGVYMAFSKNVDPNIIVQWQNTLDEMEAEGFLETAAIKWNLY